MAIYDNGFRWSYSGRSIEVRRVSLSPRMGAATVSGNPHSVRGARPRNMERQDVRLPKWTRARSIKVQLSAH